ncbi:uncharacterized protein LOC126379003 [Pectinophora gossypiella]|uniref:uncharacterized protein LOC126379003 n=1 Tax=Pectinophora gossypiella TaxID=13191 RepID=UPI00214E5146|nr:uncharacterized protein LOC126379003 [Pectinophora gossypiella]
MSRLQEVIKRCEHIKRTPPDRTITEDMTKQIAQNYRTLPSFEQTCFDLSCIKQYSMERNQLMRCRWKEYKHIEKKEFQPFFFPDHRDLHFHQSMVRFNPSLSKFRQTDHRKKLKPGPGVDRLGQMPIPVELQMKRGIERDEDKKEKVPKIKYMGKKKNKR